MASSFRLADLYQALDAERQARGLSWARATAEMNGATGSPKPGPGSAVRSPAPAGPHPLSASTVTGLRHRRVAEADGVLQMLRWLGRMPESFLQSRPPGADEAKFPRVLPGQVLRFDTAKLYAAVDAERARRNLTWSEAAAEIGLGVSSLRHLAKGGRTAFPDVMHIVGWLGRPAATFTRAVPIGARRSGERKGTRMESASLALR